MVGTPDIDAIWTQHMIRSLGPELGQDESPTFSNDVRELIWKIFNLSQTHFPKNLLWDHAFLASTLEASSKDTRRKQFDCIEALFIRFGNTGPIRFAYLHDFLYGFDWSKWVRHDPESRMHIGPFDLEFLTTLLQRGAELLELIEQNDQKYHQLRDERARNPFGFQRDPASEILLFETLSSLNAIPVQAWRTKQTSIPDASFNADETRLATATELGITR